MTPALRALVKAAGVQERWTDAAGRTVQAAEEDLRRVLHAIGLPADDEAALKASLEAALTTARRAPALLTAWCGDPLPLQRGVPPGRALFRLDGGGVFETEVRKSGGRVFANTPPAAGYHLLETKGCEIEVALAPRGGGGPPPRGFGLAVQIYALRERDGTAVEATGDFGDVARFAAAAGAAGADAVAVSPAHALFLAAPEAFQPYAPSSRLFLNGLFADADALPPRSAPEEGGALISWAAAGPERARRLRAAFERTAAGPEAAALQTFRAERGASLEAHVLFEALDAHFRALGLSGRSRWPAPFQDPASAEVAAFAARAERERAFHAFVQMAAERSRARAQAAAREAGMRVGLIADLAVGLHPEGSDAWARAGEILGGASVGAPPDLFQAHGQDWGLVGLDPRAMRAGGFKLFRETLRAALAGAGGVRIDHAMGLRRLWLVPRGASAAQGAYLAYPEADLLRLIALECARAGAVAVGEDLGTVPEGFREGLRAAGVLGMSVLWFERNGERFRPAREWSPSALAMTSTHDLATVAGWWEGRDLVWRARRAGTERAPAETEAERTRERTALWDALSAAGVAEGPPPSPQTPAAAVTGALALVADAPAPLALIPAEDLLGLPEQVNLPGDVEVHPNWRRRLEGPAARLFQTEGVAERLALLRRRRRP